VKVFLAVTIAFCAAIALVFAQDASNTGAIYGIVVSRTQEVVGDAIIEVMSGPSSVGVKVKSRGADSISYDGGFFIPRLFAGKYTIQISHEKHTSRTYENIEVSAGKGSYIVAVLQPMEDIAGGISGTVSVQGVSVEGLTVSYFKQNESKALGNVELAADGRFSFANVLPGIYVLTVSKDREEVYRGKQIKVKSKKTTTQRIRIEPEALLEKPGWISGRVLGPDRKPVSGASVQLLKMPAGQKKLSVKSDENGKFEIKNLRPGSYELKAYKTRIGEDTARTHVRSNRGKTVSFYLKQK